MTQIIAKEEIKTLTVDEINERIRSAFVYDDYQYQRDNKIKITYKDRAKNLHKILYQCPTCKTEFKMKSEGNAIWCEACQERHEMDEYGVLHSTTGDTRFPHIPDWYEWIREQVKTEIEQGQYHVEIPVQVDILPNSTGYYRLGEGTVTHDQNGFHLYGDWDHGTLDIHKPVLANYSLHVEYDYFGKGDGFSFSSTNDTFYLYPIDQTFAVSKLHFAVEELFKIESQKGRK
jgi:ribosomal protein L37AE/L43A